jgi:hypothetical protein
VMPTELAARVAGTANVYLPGPFVLEVKFELVANGTIPAHV